MSKTDYGPEHPTVVIPMERAGEQFDGTIAEFFGIEFSVSDQIRFESKLAEIDRAEILASEIGKTVFLR